jgi:hypothetical protein
MLAAIRTADGGRDRFVATAVWVTIGEANAMLLVAVTLHLWYVKLLIGLGMAAYGVWAIWREWNRWR